MASCSPPEPPAAPEVEAPASEAPAVDAPTEGPGSFPPPQLDTAERPVLSVEDCEKAGTIVGDIGDGATHRSDYRCPNGEPPIGRVNLGVEGSVCCGK